MVIQFPSVEQVREGLNSLTAADLRMLAERSDVPLTTLLNIKTSDKSRGPSLETVSKFWPHLQKLSKKTAA